jgi:hypothetical protein
MAAAVTESATGQQQDCDDDEKNYEHGHLLSTNDGLSWM